jgi:hypothetical protein
LAPHLGAAVLQPEHRFYGPIKPVENATRAQLLQLLTVPQALADMMYFIQYKATTDFGCKQSDKSSPDYCPIITIGGSYAGALAVWSRMVYPDIVDMVYTGSAPFLLYGQVPDPNVYYDSLTHAYEVTSPGCSVAIKTAFTHMVQTIHQVFDDTASMNEAAIAVGLCGNLPEYFTTPEKLAQDLVEIASAMFQ